MLFNTTLIERDIKIAVNCVEADVMLMCSSFVGDKGLIFIYFLSNNYI